MGGICVLDIVCLKCLLHIQIDTLQKGTIQAFMERAGSEVDIYKSLAGVWY